VPIVLLLALAACSGVVVKRGFHLREAQLSAAIRRAGRRAPGGGQRWYSATARSVLQGLPVPPAMAA
jgi:hypothetical protein